MMVQTRSMVRRVYVYTMLFMEKRYRTGLMPSQERIIIASLSRVGFSVIITEKQKITIILSDNKLNFKYNYGRNYLWLNLKQ